MMYAAPQAIVQPVCRQLNKKPQKTRKKSMPQLPKECLMCTSYLPQGFLKVSSRFPQGSETRGKRAYICTLPEPTRVGSWG